MSEGHVTDEERTHSDAGLPDARAAEPGRGEKRKRSKLGRLLARAQRIGQRVAAAAPWRHDEVEEPAAELPATPVHLPKPPESARRVGMLHDVAERLRGAADKYIAAKLDEIEARVDTKLDSIETRLDAKLASLDEQLRRIRDLEIRHRLRILKITLFFTVLVALLSLGYKLAIKYFAT